MTRPPFLLRLGAASLVPLVVAAVAALILADVVFDMGHGSRGTRVPAESAPAPQPRVPPDPGCIAMPNGVLVCDPEAEGESARHAADSLSVGTDAERGRPCVREMFPPREEAVAIVDAIVATVGVARNFEVLEGDFEADCIAVAGRSGNKRYIIYDRERFQWNDNKVHWDEAGIMAHEVGHLLMSHWLDGGSHPPIELEADYFAGFAVARLGGSLTQALSWTSLVSETGGATHPPRIERIDAVALGWGNAKVQEVPAIGTAGWLGEEFPVGERSCRLGWLEGREAFRVRLACQSGNRWFWTD